MIALPFNDYSCLGSITEVIAELVENQDPVITELAQQHSTREGLIAYIRGLPQRDDDGEKNDGPKVEACAPPQRLRIPASDPNCVERAALYLAVAEIIDPNPVRQLATLDTPVGMHTFPLENGGPVILDPRVSQSCLDCGVAVAKQGPSTIDPRDALEWTTQLAERNVAATRNGPSRVRRARNAVIRLVDEGIAPTRAETDSIGWMFAIAERAARRWGTKALAMVRTTALAIAEVADEVLARTKRNAANDPLGDSQFMSSLARIGIGVGTAALQSELGMLGIVPAMLPMVEQELNREGLSLGPLANPPRLTTFASMRQARAA